MTVRSATLASLLLMTVSAPALAAPKVVVSILPLHSLASAVMDGVGTPELLLSGQNSEHQASYSPAQIQMLGDSDVVFITGEGLELKLHELSGSDAVKGKRFLPLAELDGVTKHNIREGGAWEGHEHEEGHDHGEMGESHAHGTAEHDPHIWLDPANAKVMVIAIAAELSKVDPANASRYEANAKVTLADLDALSKELSAELEAVGGKPFVVFHDAYQYFEKRFGLSAVGSISDISANAPSAQRLKEVRTKLKETKATCVFREPQFSDKAAQTIAEGTGARQGVLDPIGATLEPGKGAYRALLVNLAAGLKSCLLAS